MRAIRTITAPALAGALVFLLAGPAFAGEAQPATSLSTPEEAPRPQPMVTCCHLWVGAATTAESPYLTLGLTLDRGAYLAVGVSFKYDGNGIDAAAEGTRDNLESGVFLYGGIMLKNDLPFGMGPELTIGTNLAPGGLFRTVYVTPGWNLNFVPWKAPIAIGAGIGVRTEFVRGGRPSVSLSMFPFRLTYVFL